MARNGYICPFCLLRGWVIVLVGIAQVVSSGPIRSVIRGGDPNRDPPSAWIGAWARSGAASRKYRIAEIGCFRFPRCARSTR